MVDQNDAFRRPQPKVPSAIVITFGVLALLRKVGAPLGNKLEKLLILRPMLKITIPMAKAISGLSTFTVAGFLKIEYHVSLIERHPEDPINLTEIHRLLTIMRASE